MKNLLKARASLLDSLVQGVGRRLPREPQEEVTEDGVAVGGRRITRLRNAEHFSEPNNIHSTRDLWELWNSCETLLICTKMPPSADNEAFTSSHEEQDWCNWRTSLENDGSWRPSRILALIFAFNKQRDLDPTHKTLIFDESVYFLDIVQIALKEMDDPVNCLHFSGRLSPEEKSAVIHRFNTDPACNVMLISRGAGGLGLNLTAANVVITCGPAWKQSWEEQAIRRAFRFGQLRPVTVARLVAENRSSENYRNKIRDRKHRHNDMVLQRLIDPRMFTEIA